MSTLNQQLHNSATHAIGLDANCPVCNPDGYKTGTFVTIRNSETGNFTVTPERQVCSNFLTRRTVNATIANAIAMSPDDADIHTDTVISNLSFDECETIAAYLRVHNSGITFHCGYTKTYYYIRIEDRE